MLIAAKSMTKISKIKQQLASEFEMKDLGGACKILGMDIQRDKNTRKLWLSQRRYLENVLERFSMGDAKLVMTPLASHFKLTAKQCPTSDVEKEQMQNLSYASAVGFVMYAMVCTRPDLAYAVSVVSRYRTNPGKDH